MKLTNLRAMWFITQITVSTIICGIIAHTADGTKTTFADIPATTTISKVGFTNSESDVKSTGSIHRVESSTMKTTDGTKITNIPPSTSTTTTTTKNSPSPTSTSTTTTTSSESPTTFADIPEITTISKVGFTNSESNVKSTGSIHRVESSTMKTTDGTKITNIPPSTTTTRNSPSPTSTSTTTSTTFSTKSPTTKIPELKRSNRVLKFVQNTVENVTERLDDTSEMMGTLNDTVKALTRQLILQQMYAEERIRSEGDSGIKKVRCITEGTRPYFAPSFAHNAIASIHDHSNNIRTVGMGEVVAVLNGIEFRTRHNDYRLLMPSTTSSKLHATENIPFPPVPPEVKGSIQNQIIEMRKYFKAWKNNDIRERDYRPYFKPILCYMEGSWFTSEEKVDESFFSDRHFIDAKKWFELEETIRFLSYSGAKHTDENLAYLPKIIIGQTEDGLPIFAQWNYRIVCNPIKQHLPLNRLRVVDDLKSRLMVRKNLESYALWRPARFQLNTVDRAKFRDRKDYNWLLETLMAEIPGKDNYLANITDYGYAGISLHPRSKKAINAGFYHKKYSVERKDAMGHQTRNRGFSDQNLFMSLTTQEKVAGMDNIKCNDKKDNCDKKQKWSYAIPLEIIYLTPLNNWNPYNLELKYGKNIKSVTEGGRNGKVNKPYNGTSGRNYFITPSEFFDGDEVSPDPADTAPRDAVHVLDRKGNARMVRASGVRIIFPEIKGVGTLRQRFPIMPVHGEGAGVWKELEALQDIVLKPNTYKFMYYENPSGDRSNDIEEQTLEEGLTLITGMSAIASSSQHFHIVMLSESQRSLLAQGESVRVTTSQADGHTHLLVLQMDTEDKKCKIRYTMCGDKGTCWDRHPHCLISTENN